MRASLSSLIIFFSSSSIALAQGVPPEEFFDGRYDVIGLWGEKSGKPDTPISGIAQISLADGKLKMRVCQLGEGLFQMHQAHEENYGLRGALDDAPVHCAYYIASGNYPFLACSMAREEERIVRFTLWPDYQDFSQGEYNCSAE